MSNRRSILATEEAPSTPGSPLRRSTRIANSPAPATAPAAAVSRRRSSATESTTATPAKLTRVKRQSLSHEITLEERPETPKRTTAKTPRAASRSPSAEPEVPEQQTADVGTPAKRGRRSSISKLKDEEPTTSARPETPTRRRSIRRQSTSPAKETAEATPKPRGRRASITQVNLEVIKETDANVTAASPKKVARPRTSSRRTSIDAPDESEAKNAEKEKKLPTRRSIRGRSASVDIPEEPEEVTEVKTAQDLKPINEEEAEEKVTEEKKDAEVKKQEVEVEIEPQEKSVIEEKKIDEEKGEEIPSINLDDDDDEVVLIDDAKDEVKSAGDQENSSPTVRSSRSLSLNSVTSEPGSVFKSPVRRSPRLSGSPITVSDGPEPSGSRKRKDSSPARSRSATPTSPKKDQLVATPRKSPRLSECFDVIPSESDVDQGTPRRSLKLSLSPRSKSSSLTETTSDAAADAMVASPRRSLSLRVSESENKKESCKPTRLSESADADASKEAKKEEMQQKERRKSNSLSLSDNENAQTPASHLSKSLNESKILNTLNTSNSENAKPPSDGAMKDSLLKRTPELINGSDGSFHLNLSIPTSNSLDLDDAKSKSLGNALNTSSGSNTSDKENGDKLNVIKSPKIKRVSLSVSSTPKLNAPALLKMNSFCEPIEVELTTNKDAVVASSQVVTVPKTPMDVAKTDLKETTKKPSLNDSVIEVDNEDEFGSSPVKAMKTVKKSKDVTQSEEELESELMSSFVDEVLEEKNEEAPVEVEKDKKATPKKSEVSKDKTDDKIAENIVTKQATVTATNEKVDEKVKEIKVDLRKSPETVIVDTESDSDPVEIVDVDTEEEEVIPVKEKEAPLPEEHSGSKRRKVETFDERTSQALDDLINAKLKEAAPEESDDDDEDYQPTSEFVHDMASEGEEDTPSEDSNQIIDEGESLHSSDDEELDDDEDYENDSFVTDDDCLELLSGNEYDLEEVEKPKKRKSRILKVVGSSDEDEEETKEVMKTKKKSPAAKKTQEKDSEVDADKEDAPRDKKIVVLQNIKIPSPPPQVVINEEDNLKSLEAMKDTLLVDIPKEPKPSLSTPNNSMVEPSPARRSLRKKTSINISDQIKVGRHSDGEISEKISKAVDFFVSTIKNKSGNVSLNVSLDYANSASSAEEESPKKKKRASLKKEIEKTIKVVDEIVENTVKDMKMQKERKKRNRAGYESPDDSLEDIYEVLTAPEEQPLAQTKGHKKRLSDAPAEESPGKKVKLHKNFNDDDNKLQEVKPTMSKKERRQSLNKSLDSSALGGPIKKIKKKMQMEPELESEEKEEDIEDNEEERPEKKVKLHKNFNDDDNKLQEVKPKMSKKERRQSLNKSLDSSALGGPIKKNKKKMQMEPEPESEEDEQDNEIAPVPPKKMNMKLWRDMQELKRIESEMVIEDEPNACITRSETARATTSHITVTKRRLKKVKPSVFNVNADKNDTWSVQKVVAARPSKRNKDKATPVQAQLEKMKKKMAPNDFKNQMIYSSNVKRMDSKEILKNKQKAGYVNRKQKQK